MAKPQRDQGSPGLSRNQMKKAQANSRGNTAPLRPAPPMVWSLAAPAVTTLLVLLDTPLVELVETVEDGGPVVCAPDGADGELELDEGDSVADGVELRDCRELGDTSDVLEALGPEPLVAGSSELGITVSEEERTDEAEVSADDGPELEMVDSDNELDIDDVEADGEAEELEVVLSILLLEVVVSLLLLLLVLLLLVVVVVELELELVSSTLLVFTTLLEDVGETELDGGEVLEADVELAELEDELEDVVMIMSVTEVPVCCPEVTAPGVEVTSAPGADPVVGVVVFDELQKPINCSNWSSMYVLSVALSADWSFVSMQLLQSSY